MKTIFTSEKATLKVHPEKRMVHHQIHKFICNDEFRNFMMKGADTFEQNRCNKWLSDDRGNSALKQEDVEWAQKNWEPRILKAGWKYWAIVMPEKIVGQLSMKSLVKRYSEIGVTVQIFSDPDKAMGWLNTVN